MNTSAETNYQKKRVLVTGASGFIGMHLCQKLVELDADVVGISRRTIQLPGVLMYRADLLNIEAVNALFAEVKPTIVFHLAGYVHGGREIKHVIPAFLHNTQTTVNLLTCACQNNKPRVIIAGSMEEKGINNAPSSPYSAAKQCSSQYAKMFAQLYQLPVIILKLFMAYGPGQVGEHQAKLIPYVILSFLKKQIPSLSSGRRKIDWIYIEDVVAAFIKAGFAQVDNGCEIEIGSGKDYSIKKVVEIIVDLMKVEIIPNYDAANDRVMETEASAELHNAEKLLNWKPTTSLSAGLKSTIQWYEKNASNIS